MTDVKANSIKASEVGPEMVAYLLTASILNGPQYSPGHNQLQGLPLIDGHSKEDILRTFALSLCVAQSPRYIEDWLGQFEKSGNE